MIRLALLLGILVGLAILVRVLREPLGDALIVKGIALRREARRRDRRKPTAADLMALDDPAFAAHLRATGMAQQVEAALGRLEPFREPYGDA